MAELFDLSWYSVKCRGVLQIYKPAGRVRGRIFAFHEPGGSWRTTWCHDAPPGAASVFWLREFLPQKFPRCAIYSIGHGPQDYPDRPWYEGKTSDYLYTHLRSTPLDERAPIVFITYGLGGVYLENVINKLWGPEGQLESFTPRLDQLRGVLFLGAPLRFVQDSTHYKRFFNNDNQQLFFDAHYRRLFDNDNQRLFPDTRAFDEMKHEVESITDRFKALVESCHLKIISVSEAAPHQVLQADETQIGRLPADIEEIVEGTATYFSLPKFQDSGESRFEDMCQWIQRIFGDSLSQDTDWEVTLFPLHPRRPFLSSRFTKPLTREEDFDGLPDPWYLWTPPNYAAGSGDSWVHLPANSESWMSRATRTMGHDCVPYREDYHALGTILRARSNFPHSRYVLPKFEFYEPEPYPVEGLDLKLRVSEIRIFLPYLHWDTADGFEAYNHDVWRAYSGGNSATSNAKLPSLTSLLGKDFVYYHPRRALDQYYYSRTMDTTKRDADQVVSQQTKKEEDLPGGPKMIMVDQLWLCLWVVQTCAKDHYNWEHNSSAVLTSFPSTSYERSDSDPPGLYRSADIRQGVLEKLEGNRDTPFRACEVASSILSTALLGTLSIDSDWSLDFLELFREALMDVIEKHDDFFRKFDESMDPNSERISVAERREELRLGLEIADIIDELNILSQLFVTQRDVLLKGVEATPRVDSLGSLRHEMGHILEKIDDDYLPQVHRMMKDAERVQKSLLDLLDLQQKEENIHEAHSANQQALFTAKQALSAQDQDDATEAQSQILFVFTVVTIIFLPLSFFPSYFGMFNIVDDAGHAKSVSWSFVSKVIGGASGPIIALFLGGAGIWYYLSKGWAAEERIQELLKLEDDGNIPKGLVDPNGPVRARMNTARTKSEAAKANTAVAKAPKSATGEETPAVETKTPVVGETVDRGGLMRRGLKNADYEV